MRLRGLGVFILFLFLFGCSDKPNTVELEQVETTKELDDEETVDKRFIGGVSKKENDKEIKGFPNRDGFISINDFKSIFQVGMRTSDYNTKLKDLSTMKKAVLVESLENKNKKYTGVFIDCIELSDGVMAVGITNKVTGYWEFNSVDEVRLEQR
ncbi:hypothetical protein [Peribacillus deserti]|uniref:Uncharacterized protein n=1 Tax=Peribacillus deserti TaxID=673318 RepID=A0A2N5MBU8_9BACI|nr:hypothetical protein [Peribacillus deserti]PLT31842.1 hypothetical protein CUU66_01400 [Peribacillus deserti]